MTLEEARDLGRDLLLPNRSVSVTHFGNSTEREPDNNGWIVEVEIQGRHPVSEMADLVELSERYDVTVSASPGYKTHYYIRSS